MPRSPSRDLADRYAGNRQYHRRANALEKWKFRLAVFAFLGAITYVGAGFILRGPAADYRYTHGPLANPHAAWDTNCEACHVAHGKGDLSFTGLLHADKRWLNLTCEKCHAGPAHYKDQAADSNACAKCHHDHQGRTNSLTRLADTTCTGCHAKLADFPGTAGRKTAESIKDFAAHPNFRVLETNAGGGEKRGLYFSHTMHMSKGITYPEDRNATTGKVMLVSDLPANLQSRYGDPKTPSAPVQLVCASCHQTDAELAGKIDPELDRDPAGNRRLTGDAKQNEIVETLLAGLPVKAFRPDRPSGADFLPINFDLHCKSCHPNFASQKKVDARQRGNDDIIPGFKLPHRIQPEQMKTLIEAAMANGLVGGTSGQKKKQIEQFRQQRFDSPVSYEDPNKADGIDPKILKDSVKKLAGELLALQFPRQPALRKAEGAKAVEALEKMSGCTKCHVTRDDRAGGDLADVSKLKILPVTSPTVWLPNAKFNHASHRGANCLTCHERSGYLPDQKTLVEMERLEIPAITNCQECHAPASVKDGSPRGGIRHGCTDCHSYHNGDHPLQGRGATARAPKPDAQAKSNAEFLRGKAEAK